jgi:hypothetical protein
LCRKDCTASCVPCSSDAADVLTVCGARVMGCPMTNRTNSSNIGVRVVRSRNRFWKERPRLDRRKLIYKRTPDYSNTFMALVSCCFLGLFTRPDYCIVISVLLVLKVFHRNAIFDKDPPTPGTVETTSSTDMESRCTPLFKDLPTSWSIAGKVLATKNARNSNQIVGDCGDKIEDNCRFVS